MAWKERSLGMVTHWRVFCCGSGWANDGPAPLPNVKAAENTPCKDCGRIRALRTETSEQFIKVMICGSCQSEDCEERYSFGIYAGVYCDSCWDKAGYRKDLNIVGGPTDDEIEAADYREED